MLSALSRTTLRRTAPRAATATAASVRLESTSTMHDNDPEVLEREKFKSLSKTQKKSSPHEHAPGWNEALASASEADIKADRSTGTPDELTRTTIEYLSQRRDETEGEGTISEMAFNIKDEVSGPLKGLGKDIQEEIKEAVESVKGRAEELKK